MSSWDTVDTDISVVVEPAPLTSSPFGTPVHFVADLDFGSDTYRTYRTIAALDADTDLTTASRAAGTAMFSGPNPPNVIALATVDVTGTQTYVEAATALDLILDFALFTADTRTAATQVLLAAWAEPREKVFLFQSADADWLTSGVPSAFSTIVASDGVGVVYHPTATEWADAEWSASQAAKNPDGTPPIDGAASFRGRINSPLPYTLTDAQRDFALANKANVITPYTKFGTIRAIGQGKALSGEYLYARLTKIWTKRRLTEAVMSVIQQYETTFTKVPANDAGVVIFEAACEPVGQTGLNSGAFTVSEEYPQGYTIAGSLSGQVITITIVYQLLDGVDQVVVNASIARISA